MAIKNQLSVRRLVEFIMRKGSIDSRITSLDNAMAEGTRLHTKIQKAMGPDYQKEVTLSIKVPLAERELVIDGRADGIIRDGNGVTIDEIKTSEREFEDVSQEQLDLYWYQAMCYGYMVAHEEELSEIQVQLTYMQSVSEEITRQKRTHTFAELEAFFQELISRYEVWLIFQDNWTTIRNSSIQKLTFPYGDYRKGQRELAVATYKTILSEKKLYTEAPTGTGKTISTLFPAVKSIGEGKTEKIFYLTAKTITRQVAEDAVEGMKRKGLKLKSVTLTAKDKICFLDERICTPEHCPFANGYYDRLNEGLFDLLEHEDQLTREVIEAYARKHTLCPFELSLDISLWCDTIICDYNYLFDPIVYLRRFFQAEKEDYVFLVDETHNLVNRGKEMFSASLSRNQFAAVKKILPTEDKLLRRRLTRVMKELKQFGDACEDRDFMKQSEPVDSLFHHLYQLNEAVKEWLPQHLNGQGEKEVLGLYFEVINYLKISELYDERYMTYVSCKDKDVYIKQLCLDPSYLLGQTLAKGKASVLFSASLSPLFYYSDVLGGGEEGLTYQLPSPFDPYNQLLVVADYLQTTYREREKNIPDLIESIASMVKGKTGNYMVFFPSYAYLDQVLYGFSEAHPEILTMTQTGQMSEEEREAFLNQFVPEPSSSLVAFCVLGGIFSEGIDLKGDRLSGVAIVGVGLPQVNLEQELLKGYYDQQNGDGFQYAYQIPGMNKVLQAAGRVIRDSHDIGVVLLLDQRFNTQRYKRYFPPHWQHGQIAHTLGQLDQQIQAFWQEKVAQDD
ncbi:ATP-dependent DNA helicase [uncultured Vagococcus sp.]|uniref:ATP-dependent DNA helicase n=1 Tax=uncultured Vagococcus sp. TaxID=189676 RepID=UPI0028D15A37|nr:ATP-dependent DNA helicase [uncultured Vagococcus sp.]